MIFIIFGLLVGSCGFASLAAAAVPFSDDFETYSVGTLTGQGDWLDHGNPCAVVASPTKTGSRAVSCTGATSYKISGDPILNSTEWETWVYRPLGLGDRDAFIIAYDEDGTEVVKIRWLDATGLMYCAINQPLGNTVGAGVWVKLGLKWNNDTDTVSCGINGVWSDFAGYTAWDKPIKEIEFHSGNGREMIFDDLYGLAPTPPEIAGWSPVITPTTPEDGVKTIEDLTEFDIQGLVEIPTLNPYIWHDLNIRFEKWGSTEVFTKNIPLPDLIGGDIFNYSATTTLDNAYAYAVSYQIVGETDFYTTASIFHHVNGTYVTYTAALTPIWEEVTGWTALELDDCSILTGLDGLVCEIKNLLLGLVVPSQSSLDKIVNTMSGFQDVFPLPYLRAFADFITDTDAGISESAAINFSILGQAGTIDFSVYSFDVDIAGQEVAFNVLIRSLLSLLCLAAFLAWAIFFLRSIF